MVEPQIARVDQHRVRYVAQTAGEDQRIRAFDLVALHVGGDRHVDDDAAGRNHRWSMQFPEEVAERTTRARRKALGMSVNNSPPNSLAIRSARAERRRPTNRIDLHRGARTVAAAVEMLPGTPTIATVSSARSTSASRHACMRFSMAA